MSLTPVNSLSPVLLIPMINIYTRISPRNFNKKFETAPMEYSWTRETLIHEKNLKSKISCSTPFKLPWHYSFNCTTFFVMYLRTVYVSFEQTTHAKQLMLCFLGKQGTKRMRTYCVQYISLSPYS